MIFTIKNLMVKARARERARNDGEDIYPSFFIAWVNLK